MRDLIDDIDRWRTDGKGVALATVVSVWGSAPRPPGSVMAISDTGNMAGSVSSGCVEGAVVEEARGVLADGRPKLLTFGVSDETAWSVGLSCGGEIQVLVESWDRRETNGVGPALRTCLHEDRAALVATVVGGDAQAGIEVGAQRWVDDRGTLVGTLGNASLDAELDARAASFLAAQKSVRWTPEGAPSADVFVAVHAPRRSLFVIGAVHVAIPLVHFAKTLGMQTVVVDPRTAFATHERFAHADVLDTRWPGEALEAAGLTAGSHVAALSHDLKLDVPALAAALRSRARYIGALGSRKTHAKRVEALREQGFDDADLGRIHNPIGLPLGGRRAEEIAVSIIAEIVAVQHGGGRG